MINEPKNRNQSQAPGSKMPPDPGDTDPGDTAAVAFTQPAPPGRAKSKEGELRGTEGRPRHPGAAVGQQGAHSSVPALPHF